MTTPPDWVEFEYKDQDFEFYVLLDSTQIVTARAECLENPIEETGGILIGRYSADLTTAFVTGMRLPPRGSQRKRRLFVRSSTGLKSFLARLWKEDGGYYLGEWHYHPFSSPKASTLDTDSMKQIARDASSQCARPILVILGGNPADRSQPIYVAVATAQSNQLVELSGVLSV